MFLLSCGTEEKETRDKWVNIPKGFESFDYPLDNQFSEARWELGKRLFYDPILSVDSTLSCASCHKPELAFSDNVPFSFGVDSLIGTRNTPTLANVAYHPYMLREGGVPTLEMQVLVPIQEHNEFAFNIVLIAGKLKKDEEYRKLSIEAYDQEPNPFVITRSIALFERSILSGESRFDQFANGSFHAMSSDEISGMQLFFSERTNCSQCHSGKLMTNFSFENNGLYEDYEDLGRMRFTKDETDRSLFKVPTLRNIEVTAPYMHDGSISSLEEVVEHYNNGGASNPQKSSLIQPLGLSSNEKEQLVKFLKALTDEHFLHNEILTF